MTTGDKNYEKLNERMGRFEDSMGILTHLIRTGGKDSRITETLLDWTSEECDGECEFTGVKLPTKKLVRHSSIWVHPGVAAYAEAKEIEDLKAVADTLEIPEDYLVTPYRIEFREVYRPPSRVVWDKNMIPNFVRGAMMYLCGQLHVQQQLLDRGVSASLADFRRQTNGWLRGCLEAIADGRPIPDPLPIGTVPPGRKAKPAAKKKKVSAVAAKKLKGGDEPKNEESGKSTKAQTSSTAKKAPKPASKKKVSKKAKKATSKSSKTVSKPSKSSPSKPSKQGGTKKQTKKRISSSSIQKLKTLEKSKKAPESKSPQPTKSASSKKKASKKISDLEAKLSAKKEVSRAKLIGNKSPKKTNPSKKARSATKAASSTTRTPKKLTKKPAKKAPKKVSKAKPRSAVPKKKAKKKAKKARK